MGEAATRIPKKNRREYSLSTHQTEDTSTTTNSCILKIKKIHAYDVNCNSIIRYRGNSALETLTTGSRLSTTTSRWRVFCDSKKFRTHYYNHSFEIYEDTVSSVAHKMRRRSL